MDFSKLTTGDKVLAGSGIALFLFSFFPWFGIDGYSGGGNAWDVGFFTGVLPTLIGLALVAYVGITRFADNVDLPDAPWPLIVLGLAAFAALLVVFRLAIGYSIDNPFGDDIDLDRKYGLFLATLAALGLAAGAFLKFQEEGGQLPTKKSDGPPADGGSTTPF